MISAWYLLLIVPGSVFLGLVRGAIIRANNDGDD